MSLKKRIDEDLKKAMKARDPAALSATRLLKADLTKKEIELGRDLDDLEIVKLVEKQLRQRKEAADQFRAGGRPDLAQKEDQEAAFLSGYLPARLDPRELEALVDAAIAETSATSPKDMGAVMKAALAKTQGRADGKTLSELVKKKLSLLRPER